VDDGKRVGLLTEGVGLSSLLGFNITEGYTWADGSPIAPFDKEVLPFLITLNEND
jgi:hypothetical protein